MTLPKLARKTIARLNEKCGCAITPSVKKLADRTFRFVASDATVDCQGDSVAASAWELRRFRKNPVVLFNHNPDAPVARARKVFVEAGKLIAEIQFPPAGDNGLADEVHSKVSAGLLTAMSIGALFLEWSDRSDGGRNVSKAELIELSVVAIPCNSAALRVASAMAPKAKAELEAMVSAAVAAAMPKPRLVSPEVAIEAIKSQCRKSYQHAALSYVCEHAGILDGAGVVAQAESNAELKTALGHIMSTAQVEADALASSITQKIQQRA